MAERTLQSRIKWHLRDASRRAVLRFFGRPIRCAECGGILFHARVRVRDGHLLVTGAAEHTVRAAFDGRDSLEFRHVWLDQCRTAQRPWAG